VYAAGEPPLLVCVMNQITNHDATEPIVFLINKHTNSLWLIAIVQRRHASTWQLRKVRENS